MRKFFSVTLLGVMLVIGLGSSSQAQTQQQWEQYLTWHVQQYGADSARNHIISVLTGRSASSLLQEQAWSALELSFAGGSPCVAQGIARCDQDFQLRMNQIALTTTIQAAGCVAAAAVGGTPLASAICLTAVVIRHEADLRFAEAAHRNCLRRAHADCPPPTPTPSPTPNPTPRCAILGPEPADGPDDKGPVAVRDITPLIADCSLYEDPCLCPPRSPIMIDVAGDGFDLTGLTEGVRFNITGGGLEPLGWSRGGSDDAFLALDLSGNGLIDNGAELFGNFSSQPEPALGQERNGFAALAIYDHNSDGKIDIEDPVYYALRLWQDRNHNGVSEREELHSLESLGVKNLLTDYSRSTRVDKHGNEFRYRARINDFNDEQRGRWAWDVFLVSGRSIPGGVR